MIIRDSIFTLGRVKKLLFKQPKSMRISILEPSFTDKGKCVQCVPSCQGQDGFISMYSCHVFITCVCTCIHHLTSVRVPHVLTAWCSSGMEECLKTGAAVSPADHEALGCGPAPSTHPGAPTLGRLNAERLVSLREWW